MKKYGSKPLVSVIMPVYNAGDFLVPALDSIFNQTYKNFELIVINDASIDNSLKILKKYQRLHKKKMTIINVKQNLNAGGDSCANLGLKIAKGTYIARMDADDISYPTRLEKQATFLEKHSGIFLVGSNADVIDKKGRIIGEKLEPLSPGEIYDSYMTFHPLIHPSCMFRRKVNGKPFAYQIKYNANNDYYTFFKTLCSGQKYTNLEEKLIQYRIHGHNDTFVHMKKKFMNTLRIRFSMCLKHGYRPTIKDLGMSVAQSIIIFTMPEAALTNLYLVSKGIKRPSEVLSDVYQKIRLLSPIRLTTTYL
jgi:glycosyltransferase involved in cell wall biosynthesis